MAFVKEPAWHHITDGRNSRIWMESWLKECPLIVYPEIYAADLPNNAYCGYTSHDGKWPAVLEYGGVHASMAANTRS